MAEPVTNDRYDIATDTIKPSVKPERDIQDDAANLALIMAALDLIGLAE